MEGRLRVVVLMLLLVGGVLADDSTNTLPPVGPPANTETSNITQATSAAPANEMSDVSAWLPANCSESRMTSEK